MASKQQAPSLIAALEDLVVLLRRLPAEPTLSLTAASALRAIVVEGPQRISTLVERLGISQPGTTQVVDRLVADGLAERLADPADRRVVVVCATQAGRQLLEQRRVSRGRALDALVERLDPVERRRLAEVVPLLHRLAHVCDHGS